MSRHLYDIKAKHVGFTALFIASFTALTCLPQKKPFQPSPKQKRSKLYNLLPSMLRRAIKCWLQTMALKCLTRILGKFPTKRHSTSSNQSLIQGWKSVMGQMLVLLFSKTSSRERKFIDLIMNVFLNELFTRVVQLHMDTSKSLMTVLPSTALHPFWLILPGRHLFLSGSAPFKAPAEVL